MNNRMPDAVRRVTGELPRWVQASWTVRREDSGASYEVRLHRDGGWACSCPAFAFNRDRRRFACKHVWLVRGMVQAVGLLDDEERL
jgi:hypothetical protein